MSEERTEWLAAMLAQETEQERQALHGEEQRLGRELDGVARKMDQAYDDRLSGLIDETFWTRKQTEYATRQKQIEGELERMQRTHAKADSLTAGRILELTQKAYSLYLTQDLEEKRKLLDILLSNSLLRGGTVEPEFHEPFATIAVGVEQEAALATKDQPFEAGKEIWLPGLDEETEDSQIPL